MWQRSRLRRVPWFVKPRLDGRRTVGTGDNFKSNRRGTVRAGGPHREEELARKSGFLNERSRELVRLGSEHAAGAVDLGNKRVDRLRGRFGDAFGAVLGERLTISVDVFLTSLIAFTAGWSSPRRTVSRASGAPREPPW
jgi:hypothetical protein